MVVETTLQVFIGGEWIGGGDGLEAHLTRHGLRAARAADAHDEDSLAPLAASRGSTKATIACFTSLPAQSTTWTIKPSPP